MESTDNNLDAKSKSDSFCPHYERDTCLIHFKCCPEDDWYPCHKCHNEAVASRSNNKAQKNDQPPENTASSGDTAREVPDIDWQSSSENEISNKSEDVQMERGQSTVDRGEENFVLNQLSLSSAETKHVEPALEGGRVNCTKCSHDVQMAEGQSTGNGGEETENFAADQLSIKSAETKHVELATALDGGRVNCTDCSPDVQMAEGQSTGDGGEETENFVADQLSILSAETKRVEPSNALDGGRANFTKCSQDVQMTEGQSTGDGGEENENFVADQLSPLSTETKHVELATALDGSRIKCTKCSHEQKLSKHCEKCGSEFANYFCPKCKLLIAKRIDPYHCEDCGICRANYTDHFHCKECNVCMSQSLKENHKCFADRGHDPCAICLEDVFYGAIIFPCFHMVHKECAEKLVLSGRRTCPMCRGDIGNNDADQVAAENTPQQSDSNGDLATAENTPQQIVLSKMYYIKGLLDTVCTRAKSCWSRTFGRQSVYTTLEDSGTSSGIDAFEMIVNPG